MAQPQVTSARQAIRQAAFDTPATRHLCAGAYLDRKFRNDVISMVFSDAAHRTAPSYGFDLVPVVRQAWQAWWLEAAGQVLTAAVLAAGTALDIAAVVTAACAAGIWYLGRTALRTLPEMARLGALSASARWLRRPLRAPDRDRHRELSRLVALACGGCAALAMIGGVAATSRGSLVGGALAAAFLLLMLALASAATAAIRQMALIRTRSVVFLRPARSGRRLTAIDQQQSCDHVIYRKPSSDEDADENLTTPSWDYELTPFTGSGKLVHRWLPPVSVQLLRPGEGSMRDREYPVAPFAAHEVIDHIREAMQPVGDAADPDRLRGFQVSDRLYTAEAEVADDRTFLLRPCTPDEINRIIDDPHARTRHYLEMPVSTEGEVVTTVFLRVTVRGRALSLDFTACALTRTPDSYHVLNQYAESGAGAVMRAALRAVARIPQDLGGLWRLGLMPGVLIRAAWAMKDRTVIPRRRRPIGTRFSIREEIAEDWEDAEHDKTDIYNEIKIIEERLLKATEDFLDSREIDTSMFKRRIFSIVNMGVLNMGRLEMNQSAAGSGAQVNFGSPDDSPDPGKETT
jgi:hypothetical protein